MWADEAIVSLNDEAPRLACRGRVAEKANESSDLQRSPPRAEKPVFASASCMVRLECMQRSEASVILDTDVLQASLERRLRARAARADSAVEITRETLERWLQEEFASVVAEHALVQAVAHGHALN
jgi:hypothetical protein